jgi:hypothetical protein
MEHYLEARLWNDVFIFSQGISRDADTRSFGTIKKISTFSHHHRYLKLTFHFPSCKAAHPDGGGSETKMSQRIFLQS